MHFAVIFLSNPLQREINYFLVFPERERKTNTKKKSVSRPELHDKFTKIEKKITDYHHNCFQHLRQWHATIETDLQ